MNYLFLKNDIEKVDNRLVKVLTFNCVLVLNINLIFILVFEIYYLNECLEFGTESAAIEITP